MNIKKTLHPLVRIMIFIPVVGMVISWHYMSSTDQWEWDEPDQTLLPLSVATQFMYYVILFFYFIYVNVAVLPFR